MVPHSSLNSSKVRGASNYPLRRDWGSSAPHRIGTVWNTNLTNKNELKTVRLALTDPTVRWSKSLKFVSFGSSTRTSVEPAIDGPRTLDRGGARHRRARRQRQSPG